MSEDKSPCNWSAALNAGAAIADGKLFEIEGTPAVLVPEGYEVRAFPDHREAPLRISQQVQALTAEAFIAYVNRFHRDNSIVFADCENAMFQAVLDYHDPGLIADWCCHRIKYACPRSKEWMLWTSNSGKQMDQAKFAEFIEDNLIDIVEPAGAEMLEVAKTLDTRQNVRFKSGIRLDNGETQLTFEEVIDGTAGAKGQLKIPQVIQLALRVFQGEDPYAVEARFKYRIKEGNLTMWYELVRPHRIVEDSFSQVLERIREQLDIQVLEAVLA